MQVDQVTDPVAFHGEGPVWSASWGGLRWVDMLAGDILSLADDGSVGRRHVGSIAAVLRPRRQGGAVIAVERGFVLEAPDGALTQLDEVWSDTSIRMNEGGCDPDGRFYAGSMAYDKRPGGATVYRLDPDRSVHRVIEGVTISNGLEWSPDDALAYYVDTDTSRIDVFDYDREGGLTDRRPFVDVSDEGLRPDGLTVDREGAVWVAFFNGSVVRRYTANGKLDAVISVPARKVTACTIGGRDLDTLFITTSRDGLGPGEDPLAGSLFSVNVGKIGRPVREFDG